jgi:hypothetical protein
VAHRRQQPTPGERFTATVTALGAVLLPFTALGGDAQTVLAPQFVASAKPTTLGGVDPGVGADGRTRTDPGLSPQMLAGLNDPKKLATGAGPLAQVPAGALGIPGRALQAYLGAAHTLAGTDPGCGLHWSVLAAIGRVESDHARGGQLDAAGNTLTPILGPELNGSPGLAAIRATDGGRLDGDPVWERAVGPMQFIPSTWWHYAPSPTASPSNIDDAALAAGKLLCSGGGNLRDPGQLAAAIFRYNPSEDYVRTVLVWAARYAAGVIALPPDSPPGDVAPASLASSVQPIGGPSGAAAFVAAPAPGSPAPAPAVTAPAPTPAPAPAPAAAHALTPAPTPTPAPAPHLSSAPPPPPPSSSTPPPPSSSTPPPPSSTATPATTTSPTPTG